MDEVIKILNDYISTHNKNFDFYSIKCEFAMEFDNNFIANKKTNYFYNTDIININKYLLYDIDSFRSSGHKFYNIIQKTVNIITDRYNLTYELYMNQTMSVCERKVFLNIAKNPQLINLLKRTKNHPLTRKYSHTPFNN